MLKAVGIKHFAKFYSIEAYIKTVVGKACLDKSRPKRMIKQRNSLQLGRSGNPILAFAMGQTPSILNVITYAKTFLWLEWPANISP